MRRRVYKILGIVAAVIVVVLLGGFLWLRAQARGSLPQLDGEIAANSLTAPVTVERDELGIPTITAENRADLAFATGYVHAQDRFFQMDLLRRNSAGELSEIVGRAALNADRKMRVNRFRAAAQRVVKASGDEENALLGSYTEGVNAGLASLSKKPFEYMMLGVEPTPWKPEDSVLVMYSMYLDLQGGDFRDEAALGLMHDVMPQALFDFVAPRGTSWDAPIQGEAFAMPPAPSADVFDTRTLDSKATAQLAPVGSIMAPDIVHPGSNNWAVAGSQTADGRALLANDMHLGIRVPHVWYRASMVWPVNGQENRVTGVSLPGTPAVVVGSNGHVAWGFTNSEGDWVDVILVDVDPADKDSYLTPDGPKKFEKHVEAIKIKGEPDDKFEVVSTIWGPIVDHDHKGRPRANRWVAHDTEGVNMGLMRMESVDTLEGALELANLSGSPHQNFVVADDKGQIAWTIIGRIPRRVGFDGRLPSSWADGSHRWDGYLKPEEYPRVVNPPNGRIWTANARVVSGEFLEKLGDGGYDLGARAGQIRDDLLATEKATEADMLRIQLDDKALFLEPWRKLLLDTLTEESVKADPRRGELRKYVEEWGGRAATDSVGFRAVRTFRRSLLAQLSDVLVAPCKKADDNFSISRLDRTEGPVWYLVSQKPEHLIDPRYKDWDALLLAAADRVIDEATQKGHKLSSYTWGQHNTTKIQHPLSAVLPGWIGAKFNMPAQPLPGDSENMPRIQAPSMGASERLGVSPGHEEDGYCHIPVGQSGHFLSPHYGDSHADWAEGKPSKFLPGKPIHKLVLKPQG